MTKSIAIVSMIPKGAERISGFGTDFQQIRDGLRRHAPGWRYTEFVVGAGELPMPADGFDGVVLTGSPNSVNEDAHWVADVLAMIRAFHGADIPMAGICFGHQAIAKALGGQVGPSPQGWSLGVVPVRWQDDGLTGDLSLYAVHQEQVLQPPAGAQIVASTPTCPIAGMRMGRKVLTTQHHPEMPMGYVGAVLDLLAADAQARVPDELLTAARVSLALPTDNDAFMAAFVRFFAAASPEPALQG